jgi:hypothetical protein
MVFSSRWTGILQAFARTREKVARGVGLPEEGRLQRHYCWRNFREPPLSRMPDKQLMNLIDAQATVEPMLRLRMARNPRKLIPLLAFLFAVLSVVLFCTRVRPDYVDTGGLTTPQTEVAIWVDKDTGNYCLALDLSFGMYPQDGQMQFKKITSAIFYVKSVCNGYRIAWMNGNPSGDYWGHCRDLTSLELQYAKIWVGDR